MPVLKPLTSDKLLFTGFFWSAVALLLMSIINVQLLQVLIDLNSEAATD
jgi:hypothetical protein